MSFRTAYSDFKRSGSSRNRGLNQGLIRDYTPAQKKKMMQEYYTLLKNWNPKNGRW